MQTASPRARLSCCCIPSLPAPASRHRGSPGVAGADSLRCALTHSRRRLRTAHCAAASVSCAGFGRAVGPDGAVRVGIRYSLEGGGLPDGWWVVPPGDAWEREAEGDGVRPGEPWWLLGDQHQANGHSTRRWRALHCRYMHLQPATKMNTLLHTGV